MSSEQNARELDNIIRNELLTPFFQPIFSTHRAKIYGYEALARGPSMSALHYPRTLFQVAAKQHRLVEVDMLARKIAIRHFKQLGLSGKLFLNVMPHTLFQNDFREGATLEFLHQEGVDPQRVVIEVTEHSHINDYSLMRHALDHYRRMGFRVALDDLGAGSAGLGHWAELGPDYVKTSHYFCQHIDTDLAKHKFLDYLLEVSRNLGCEIIFEGVERREEYETLVALNGNLLQGHYISFPAANPPQDIDQVQRDNCLPVTRGEHSYEQSQPMEFMPMREAIDTSPAEESSSAGHFNKDAAIGAATASELSRCPLASFVVF
ncbi:EAL domain-containing protein [Halorhodospira halochloris]|uniref:EAL domain-containing protein n=1 Tax=Halorhodospira halochloris TaxID=1052 RepID=UPI001EE919E3|nr:EAL domain-containing protein [Halorhodospira halochloris]MCG5548413.1 EAL domain-containing protein [Halorhodospira halochloris]